MPATPMFRISSFPRPARLRAAAAAALLLLGGCVPDRGGNLKGGTAPANLAYATSTAVFTKGVAITPDSPSSSGGPATAYAISPALPQGLAFNTATGIISGTPAVLSPATSYTVTAFDAEGSTAAALTVTIDDAAPAGLAYAVNPAVFIWGAAISPDGPTSSGGAATAYSISPALPQGLALDAATGLISGTPAVLSAATAYTVTATDTGGSTTATLTITVNDAAPADLAYAVNPAVFTVGVAITPDDPSSGGGAATAYSISPALPQGLALDPATGIISGIPAVPSPATPDTVTATDSGGSSTGTLTLTVAVPAPVNLAYALDPAVFTVGVAVTDAPSSGGGAVVSYAVTPALPSGLALDTGTGVISGTPTAVASQATYTVTATNAGGQASLGLSLAIQPPPLTIQSQPAAVSALAYTTASFSVTASGPAPLSYQWQMGSGDGSFSNISGATGTTFTTGSLALSNSGSRYQVVVTDGYGTQVTSSPAQLTVTQPSPRFAFLANAGDNTLSAYTVDAVTGQFRPHGYVLTGKGPSGVATDPSGSHLYVANATDNSISAFSIDPGSGALAAIGTPTRTGSDPVSITIDPTGSYLYVLSGGSPGSVWSCTIASSGALSGLFETGTGSQPVSFALTPSGQFAYVANAADSSISVYAVSGGVLTVMDSLQVNLDGFTPTAIAIDPAGAFAYVTAAPLNPGADGVVYAEAINATSGALTLVSQTDTGGTAPASITLDRAGQYAYVVNGNGGTGSVAAFTTASGNLAMVGSPVPAGQGSGSVTIDPSNQFVRVTNATTEDVWTYDRNPGTGALNWASTVRGRAACNGLAVTQGSAPVSYAPAFAYVMDNVGSQVYGFAVNPATGALTAVPNNPFPIPASPGTQAAASPVGMAFDPAGRFAFVANNGTGTISEFTISSTGALVANGAVSDSAPSGTSSTNGSPGDIVLDPSGRFAFVENTDGSIQPFSIDPSSWTLTALAPYVGLPQLNNIAIDPTGQFLLAAASDRYAYTNPSPSVIYVLTIDPATGALAPSTTLATGTGDNPFEVIVDPSGQYAYVANFGIGTGTDQVWAYSITAGTGALNANVNVPSGDYSLLGEGPGNGLESLATGPTDGFMFAAFYNGYIGGFTLDPASGTLAVPPSTLENDTFNGQRYMVVDPSGRFLFVAIPGALTLVGSVDNANPLFESFSFDPSTGALGPAPVSIENDVVTASGVPSNPSTLAVTETIQ